MAELVEAELSSYADLAQVIRDLPVIVRSARRMRRLSLREAAAETGLSFSTIHRVESGHDFDSGTLQALLRWLDDPTAPTTGATEVVELKWYRNEPAETAVSDA